MISRKRSTGLSLIEILIAVVIVAVGLLGMAGLQSFSLKNNTSAYHRSQANSLLYDVLDAMRANRAAILQYSSKTEILALSGPAVSGDRLAADLTAWTENLAHYLPAGAGMIVCGDPQGVCVATVYWDDTRRLADGATCATKPESCEQMSVSTRL